MDGVLVGICNPLLDISAHVDHSLLSKYELKSGNAILAEPKHLPLYQELTEHYQVHYIAGGAGQNTIRAAQWMLQKPHSTIYIGCIGKDENGKKLRQEAQNDGVNVQYLEDEKEQTGTCAVLITNKERSLVANLGAANCYKKEHFDSSQIQSLVGKALYFYITGFFLTVSPETMIAVGKHVAEHDKTFFLNLSAPFLIDFFYDKLTQVLPYVDVVFGNESEFEALSKKEGWNDGTNLKQTAQKLAEQPKVNQKKSRVVILTQGPQPVIAYQAGKFIEVTPEHVPNDEIVDTNGAGDSFAGGFLAMFVQGKPLEECIRAGNYCAGVTIRTDGTTFRTKTPNFTG
jgi:adenosine kinase